MELRVSGPNFADIMRDIEGDVATAATEAMRGSGYKTLLELRRQVTDNGLGQRLANTWRDRTYPEKRKSMTPTGYIGSNAPDIVESFTRGATIRPHGGAKYLWIPTKNVPRARGRVSARGRNLRGGAMSPEEVEVMFRSKLFIRPGRAGSKLAFVETLTGRKGAKGAGKGAGKPLLMFVLRRTVRLPKLLDLQGPARLWEQRFADEFSRRLAD